MVTASSVMSSSEKIDANTSHLSSLKESNRKASIFIQSYSQNSSTQIPIPQLKETIRILLENPHFPMLDQINNIILQNEKFLYINDKYLLINYLTNYTTFIQTFVDKNNISPQSFAIILEDIKQNNEMPEEISSHVKAFYSKYNKLDRNITKNIRLNIEREIETLPPEQKTLLYARLYLNGNVKYKKYYQTAEESELSSEMYILDKILYHYKTKNFKDVAYYISQLPATLQDGDLWWNATQVMVFDMLEQGYRQEAYNFLARIQLNITHENYTRKEIYSGVVALLNKKPNVAYTHFYNVYSNTHDINEKNQGAYFIAQSYLKMGNNEAYTYWLSVVAQSPLTFYGSRAIDELNGISQETFIGSKNYLSSQWGKAVKKRREIYKQYYDSFVSKTLKMQKPYTKLPNDLLEMLNIAYFLKEANRLNAAKSFILSTVRQVDDITYMGSLLEHVCTSYNKYICSDAKRAAEDIGYIELDGLKVIKSNDITNPIKENHLAILHAIIKKESNFTEQISSGAGAKGMMQIMPATAKFVCSKHGIAFNSTKLQTNAGYNIYLGTIYLNDLLEKYSGSYAKTLIAYNAGYGNLAKWENIYFTVENYQDMVMFIELMPFYETRRYVKKVLEWEGIYGYVFEYHR